VKTIEEGEHKTMSEIITGLTLPIVLSVSGAVFVLLGIAGNVELKGIVVRLPHERQRGMIASGIVLVLLGVSVYVLSVIKSSSITSTSDDVVTDPITAVTTHTSTSAPTATCFSALEFGAWDASYQGYGDANRIPVPADYDGDGKADLSVKDADGIWWIDYAKDGFGEYNEWYGGYGDASHIPVPVDYDGDGKADLSVKDADGVWWIDCANDGFGEYDEWHGGYGDASRIPVPADYDGDGRVDLSVKDPDGIWWIDYASK
jgi:catechol 2,3-dioxygenase-like lactoylglutathione lyase family enzyme